MLTSSQKRFDLMTAAVFAALLMLLATFGCVPVVAPLPTPPPAPRLVQVTIVGEDGHTPPGTFAAVVDDKGDEYPCSVRIAADRVGCVLGAAVPLGNPANPSEVLAGGNLIVRAPGYEDYDVRVGFTGFDMSLSNAILKAKPKFVALPRLVTAGQFFRKADGERFTAIEASDFNAFNRFLLGENIEPVLEQRASIGFNMLRVFTAYNVCPPGSGCQEIGRLVPREHGDYAAKLRLFARAAAAHGLYLELTAFTGPYGSFFDTADQMVAHWALLAQAAADETNIILELVNEFDQTANAGIPIERLQQPPPPVLASHGSNGSEAEPVKPLWSFVTFHTNGAFQAVRKVGHNCWELSASLPCLSNENTRSPDNFSSNKQAFDSAAGAGLLAGGSAFHSVHGKNSTLWVGIELENAKAWVAGARSVPLKCQDGGYVHRDDLEGTEFLRVYQRGSDPDCIVRIRE